MIYFQNAAIVLLTFILMELVAWGLHKYILHTFLWRIHDSHHKPRLGLTEKNDIIAFVFAIPSWLCMMFGIMDGNDFKLYIGIGILLYGIAYFLIHDGLIHRRIKVFSNSPKSVYLLGVKIGHLAHHKHDSDKDYNKDNDVAWGMLWVPKEYFEQARKILKNKKG